MYCIFLRLNKLKNVLHCSYVHFIKILDKKLLPSVTIKRVKKIVLIKENYNTLWINNLGNYGNMIFAWQVNFLKVLYNGIFEGHRKGIKKAIQLLIICLKVLFVKLECLKM